MQPIIYLRYYDISAIMSNINFSYIYIKTFYLTSLESCDTIITKEKKGEGKMKKRKERTDRLAKLFVETNDLLAELERSVIAGLRKEINRESSFRKREAEKKEVER